MRKCPNCVNYFRCQNEYVQHLIENHPELGIREEIIHFDGISEFERWKHKTEKRDHCRWRQNSGMRRMVFERRQTYFCRQSVLGKNEAQRSCPSSIQVGCPYKVSINVRTGRVVATFCPTHLGHNPADDPPIVQMKSMQARHKHRFHPDLLPTPCRLKQTNLKMCDISNVMSGCLPPDHDYELKPLYFDDTCIATVEVESTAEITPRQLYETFVSSLYRHSEVMNQHSVEQIKMIKDQIESVLKQNDMFVSD